MIVALVLAGFVAGITVAGSDRARWWLYPGVHETSRHRMRSVLAFDLGARFPTYGGMPIHISPMAPPDTVYILDRHNYVLDKRWQEIDDRRSRPEIVVSRDAFAKMAIRSTWEDPHG